MTYREVQEELLQRKGIDIPMTHVIITSDEKDPAWWDEVQALGWVRIDHDVMRTEEVYGKWQVTYHLYLCGLPRFISTDALFG